MSADLKFGDEVIVAIPTRRKRRARYLGPSRTGLARVEYWVEHLGRYAYGLVYVHPTFVELTPAVREVDAVRQWGADA